MSIGPITAIADFEVYLLMTMRLRISMSHKEAQLQAKLAEHGPSLDGAKNIHERVAGALGDEASGFENLKNLLGVADRNSTTLKYDSVLWPGFDFNATADENGPLESARYRHSRRNSPSVDSPTELTIWSMDVTEFTEHYGPMAGGQQWPLFDEFLPAYEE
jgi:hypothetical protein